MSASPEAAAPSTDWRRPLRYLWRLPILTLHVVVGLPITLLMINPLCARVTVRDERLDHRVIRLWSGEMKLETFVVHRPDWIAAGEHYADLNHLPWLNR